MSVLVTGAAGFIGMYTADALLKKGEVVIGIDNINDYYDPELKKARLAKLQVNKHFYFEKLDFAEQGSLDFLDKKYLSAPQTSFQVFALLVYIFCFFAFFGVFWGFWRVLGPIFRLFRVFYVDCARFRPKRPKLVR